MRRARVYAPLLVPHSPVLWVSLGCLRRARRALRVGEAREKARAVCTGLGRAPHAGVRVAGVPQGVAAYAAELVGRAVCAVAARAARIACRWGAPAGGARLCTGLGCEWPRGVVDGGSAENGQR